MEVNSFVQWPHELDFASGVIGVRGREVPARLGGFELQPMQQRAAAAVLAVLDGTSVPEVSLVLPFGSGKTVVSACVVHHILKVSRTGYTLDRAACSECALGGVPGIAGAMSIVVEQTRVLPITVVFARTPTVDEWVAHLQRAGVRAVRAVTAMEFQTRFLVELREPGGPPWDAVVVRDGETITLNLHKSQGCSTVDAVRHAFETARIAALLAIYDDFDRGKMPAGHGIPARAALLVSGSTKGHPRRNYLHPSIVPSKLDSRLVNMVCVAPREMEMDTQVPALRAVVIVLENPDDRFAAMLNDLAGDAVAEMLNGMAYTTAAEHLGIKTRSPAAMFKAVLKRRYNEWIMGRDALRYLEDAGAALVAARAAARAALQEDLAEYIEHGRKKLQRGITALAREPPGAAAQTFTWAAPPLEVVADRRAAEVRQTGEEANTAIQRFRARVSNGECLICSEDEIEDGIFILTCCYTLLCGDCFRQGMQRQNIAARCPTCRCTINLKESAIFVEPGADLGEMLRGPIGTDGEEEEAPVKAEDAAGAADAAELPPKLMALLYIINGKRIPEDAPHVLEQRPIEIHLPNVLGLEPAPAAAGRTAVLVFASYEESLELIENTLLERNITFARLSGHMQTNQRALGAFRDGTAQVLLVCSQQDCAGLNLQHATDIVFFNEIRRRAELAQAIGRVQRFGRRGVAARCHILAFPNEMQGINNFSAPAPEDWNAFYPAGEIRRAAPEPQLELARTIAALQRRLILERYGTRAVHALHKFGAGDFIPQIISLSRPVGMAPFVLAALQQLEAIPGGPFPLAPELRQEGSFRRAEQAHDGPRRRGAQQLQVAQMRNLQAIEIPRVELEDLEQALRAPSPPLSPATAEHRNALQAARNDPELTAALIASFETYQYQKEFRQ